MIDQDELTIQAANFSSKVTEGILNTFHKKATHEKIKQTLSKQDLIYIDPNKFFCVNPDLKRHDVYQAVFRHVLPFFLTNQDFLLARARLQESACVTVFIHTLLGELKDDIRFSHDLLEPEIAIYNREPKNSDRGNQAATSLTAVLNRQEKTLDSVITAINKALPQYFIDIDIMSLMSRDRIKTELKAQAKNEKNSKKPKF